MKAYIKPEIAEVELFTQDSIALTIPKTTYRRIGGGSFSDSELIAYALKDGEALSGQGVAGGAN